MRDFEATRMKACSYGFLVLLAFLVACGDGTENTTPGEALVSPPSEQIANAPSSQAAFLRSLPDACAYLTASLAQELLQTEVTQRPPVSNSCAYVGPAGSSQHIGFSMFLWDLDMMDSNTESPAQLQQKSGLFAQGKTPAATLHDLGNIAFVFNEGSSTSLFILTGIGGTAVMSDHIVSELSLSYSLSDSNRTEEERMTLLQNIARDHLARIEAIASTTHEGRAGS